MKITKIDKQRRNRNRYNLFVDGQYQNSFSYEVILDFRFVENKDIDDKILADATRHQGIEDAYQRALNIISYRMNSEMELKRKLKKHYQDDIINETIKKLKKLSFIDDDRFADLWIAERKNRKGRRLLEAELIRKGIDREIITKSLKSFSRQDEVYAAIQLIEKRFKGDIQPEKALQYLANRGYDYEIAKRILKEDK